MRTSTYYDLKLVEGTDIVNPLTTEVPNLTKIDEVMHNNAIAGVTLATELTNGTIHSILRENTECAIFRFIATSEWKAGDSVTVDGVPVTALLPNGETLSDGAYVINANVLCVLTGTNLTVFVDRKKIDNASEVKYGDTTVKTQLDKLTGILSIKVCAGVDISATLETEFQLMGRTSGNNTQQAIWLSIGGVPNRYGTLYRVDGSTGMAILSYQGINSLIQYTRNPDGTWVGEDFARGADLPLLQNFTVTTGTGSGVGYAYVNVNAEYTRALVTNLDQENYIVANVKRTGTGNFGLMVVHRTDGSWADNVTISGTIVLFKG